MLFNSLEYLFFLPIIFIIYWLLKKQTKLQNIVLLMGSYFFYGLWDYRFLSLIIISSLTDFLIGLYLEKVKNPFKRKLLLFTSLGVNLGFLLVFKYFNFFIDSFSDLSELLGFSVNITSLNIILPVGISFYTFQTLSYTIDIYRKKLKPTQSLLNFFTYVAFFPQLVAGPIERASKLLPQIENKREFNYYQGLDGMRQILWGLFKKVVIADNCAIFVDSIFSNYGELGSIPLFLGAVLFAFQIYCDFSGYSDIAIGSAKLLGINLMQNFATPYFSRDIAEFWRRWHISLSTWFRDYLYIPLGGSKAGRIYQLRNIFAIFLVSGFWHGANWTFIFWGLIHALCYIPQVFSNTNRRYIEVIANGRLIPTGGELLKVILTFVIVTFTWIFFRSNSITESFDYIGRMFSALNGNFIAEIQQLKLAFSDLYLIGGFIMVLLAVEWLNRSRKHGLEKMPSNVIVRYGIYITLCLSILEYFFGETSFIYFQF